MFQKIATFSNLFQIKQEKSYVYCGLSRRQRLVVIDNETLSKLLRTCSTLKRGLKSAFMYDGQVVGLMQQLDLLLFIENIKKN